MTQHSITNDIMDYTADGVIDYIINDIHEGNIQHSEWQ